MAKNSQRDISGFTHVNEVSRAGFAPALFSFSNHLGHFSEWPFFWRIAADRMPVLQYINTEISNPSVLLFVSFGVH